MAEPITLRRATAADVELVFAWANDPVTRAVSFASEPIAHADHLAWFDRQLADADRNLLIAEQRGQPIAVVRLDRSSDAPDLCVISINVDPQARGRGLGSAVLVAASATASELAFRRIRALIRPDNHASVRAFVRAGYVDAGTTRVAGQDALVLERVLPD